MSDSQKGSGIAAAVAGAIKVGGLSSAFKDVQSGDADTKDHRIWSKYYTRQGSYQAPAAPLTYGFINITEKPEKGRVWEVLHMHIAGGLLATGQVDPFTAVAIPALAFITEEIYNDSATEPPIFPDIVGKFASLDGTPNFPPSRRGVLLRWPQRFVFVVKGAAAGTLIQASIALLDHDEQQFMQKVAGG